MIKRGEWVEMLADLGRAAAYNLPYIVLGALAALATDWLVGH